MNHSTYYNLKQLFLNLTGKNADDNLEAFFSYVNTLNLLDIKERIDDLRARIANIENNTKSN
jgi:hypothetical protein